MSLHTYWYTIPIEIHRSILLHLLEIPVVDQSPLSTSSSNSTTTIDSNETDIIDHDDTSHSMFNEPLAFRGESARLAGLIGAQTIAALAGTCRSLYRRITYDMWLWRTIAERIYGLAWEEWDWIDWQAITTSRRSRTITPTGCSGPAAIMDSDPAQLHQQDWYAAFWTRARLESHWRTRQYKTRRITLPLSPRHTDHVTILATSRWRTILLLHPYRRLLVVNHTRATTYDRRRPVAKVTGQVLLSQTPYEEYVPLPMVYELDTKGRPAGEQVKLWMDARYIVASWPSGWGQHTMITRVSRRIETRLVTRATRVSGMEVNERICIITLAYWQMSHDSSSSAHLEWELWSVPMLPMTRADQTAAAIITAERHYQMNRPPSGTDDIPGTIIKRGQCPIPVEMQHGDWRSSRLDRASVRIEAHPPATSYRHYMSHTLSPSSTSFAMSAGCGPYRPYGLNDIPPRLLPIGHMGRVHFNQDIQQQQQQQDYGQTPARVWRTIGGVCFTYRPRLPHHYYYQNNNNNTNSTDVSDEDLLVLSTHNEVPSHDVRDHDAAWDLPRLIGRRLRSWRQHSRTTSQSMMSIPAETTLSSPSTPPANDTSNMNNRFYRQSAASLADMQHCVLDMATNRTLADVDLPQSWPLANGDQLAASATHICMVEETVINVNSIGYASSDYST
ncbi:hypothetical protein BDF22DRAFT_731445 [Syncephalis plumigaleata]|nr:hypothetical protein BDF22DRAFT_731445 [Syncephalis plumigaleata]